jgi:gamma-glutamyltranspeptidase / glutathione hydrolase
MTKMLMILVLALVLVLAPWPSPAQSTANKAVQGKQGMVVTVSAPASDVGVEILKQGGNAVDAAVAVALALAVTHPAAGNIGGGGYMVIHPASGEPTVIDYRETAPAKASSTMFKKGESTLTHRAVGVPGTIRGLELAHKRFGKLPWSALVAPAIALAEKGFVLDTHHASSLNGIVRRNGANHPELVRVFGKDGPAGWTAGDSLVQPDLARTLRLLAKDGPDAFYKGTIAELIDREMKAGGGLIDREDLARYTAIERKAVQANYRGYDVYGPPPSSSGGVCVAEMLQILQNFDLKKHDRWSKETLHLMIEAMKRAFCDRARWLGDPAFTEIPANLSTREYGAKLASQIDPTRPTKSESLAKEIPLAGEGDSTTHFSVIDGSGMAVANTYTLEHSYGSCVVVKGAGFLLNNEMSDFNWQPGVTNRKGLIGTAPNTIAPGKRMLSSQTPTIVAKNGKVVLVTGSPGSRTIINTVLGILVSVLDYGMDVQEAVDAPRIHHQWFPDETSYENRPALKPAVEQLKAMGHAMRPTGSQGDAHTIWIDPATRVFLGAADRRLSGKAAGY